jgi:hypothetical protein
MADHSGRWLEVAFTQFICRTHFDINLQFLCTFTKKKSNPITGLDKPWGVQEVEAPRFVDNQHMKLVRLSALRTGRLYITPTIINNTTY